jgi:hypothetical protein
MSALFIKLIILCYCIVACFSAALNVSDIVQARNLLDGRKMTEDYTDPISLIYKNYNHNEGLDHWMDYGKHYSQHFEHFRKYEVVNILEIGVASGGSTRVWRDFFGSALRYTGLDINPKCKQFEDTSLNINVIIGSQMDKDLLKKICQDHGPFDIVIDDGGHQSDQILTSFEALWLCMKDKGVYAIEDLHALSMYPNSDFYCIPGSGSDGKPICKDVYQYMVDFARAATTGFTPKLQVRPQDPMAKHAAAISFYDSMTFLHWQTEMKYLERIMKGQFIH